MRIMSLIAAAVLAVGMGSAALAQTTSTAPAPGKVTAPAKPAASTAPAIAPATTAAPAASAATTTAPPTTTAAKPGAIPAGTKVNLNTATAQELDALPQVGKSRVKAIMTERAKSPFKDWADFDTRMNGTSVNAGVKAKIKDLVTF